MCKEAGEVAVGLEWSGHLRWVSGHKLFTEWLVKKIMVGFTDG